MSFQRILPLAGFAWRHLGRMRRGRRAVEAHLERPGERPVPPPTFVQLRVTNLCNLRCRMCGQWGDTGIYRPDGTNESVSDGGPETARIRELVGLGRQLGLDDYRRLLDEIAPWKPIVSLYGGEPLLYPDFVPLVREIKRRGLVATVITNASRLEENSRELVEAGLDVVSVSVDGPPDLHDRIRGAKGSFDRIAAGVRAVDRWRRKLGRATPMQLAILPVTELNHARLGEAVDALRPLPLEAVNVGLRWFVPPEVGAGYEKVMQEAFGIRATSWTGFRFEWPTEESGPPERALADVVKLLQTLRRRRFVDAALGRPWVSFVPEVAADDVPAWMGDHTRSFGHDFCPVPWYFAQVEADGDLAFCGDFPDYVLGNVRRESFRAAWWGEKARLFREKLAREPLPVCSRCCGRYVYGRWSQPEGPRP